MKAMLIVLGLAATLAMSGCIICDDTPDRGHHNPPPPPQKTHVQSHGGHQHTPPPPPHGAHRR